MMKQLVVTLALALPGLALACDGDGHAEAKKTRMTIAQVAQARKAGQVTAVDANGEKTRAQYGVVPGAILLTSSSKFEPSKELPADKHAPLVFYCASVKCEAAPGAAKRAAEAGYTHVSVMPEGIMGWVKSGQPVDKPAAAVKS